MAGVWTVVVLLAVAQSASSPLPETSRAAADDRRVLTMIDQLRDSPEWQARLEAAVFLGRSGDIRARRPLVQALADPHFAVRTAAIRSLTNIGDARAIRPLLDRLTDDEPFVRAEARDAIDGFDLEAARPYLIHALRHPSREVRMAAAERLASLHTKDGIASLLDAVGDEDEVGEFAITAIRSLDEDDAVALFVDGLEASDYGIQVASIRALAEMGTPAAIDPLIALLDSGVPDVRIAAAEGLRELADQVDKSRMLVLARRASSRFERARAMKVLGILGGEDSTVLLLNALDDPDLLVRGAAVSALASLEEVRAIPKLEDMKKDENNGRIIALVRRTLVNLQRIRERKA